jgi:trehalose 6-phosphate synthase/phosphatase
MGRLILVSNRLPFSIEKSGIDNRLRQSSGGLVSAIKSYFDKHSDTQHQFSEKIWVGSVDFSLQDLNNVKEQVAEQAFSIQPVFIEEEEYNNYYNGFSNSTLWPLFHYFPSFVEFRKEYFDSYKKVNEHFAETILPIIKDDDVIWIHDYQLMLLSQLIRRQKPNASIGFFLHIPFPSYELLRLLPADWKSALLTGVMGADLVGFHTHEYVQHFIRSVKMIIKIDNQFNLLHYQNRLVKADMFPIGVDYEKFSADDDANVNEQINQFKNAFADKKIIFSVDRQDYTKGLMDRLQGYDQFLIDHPEWKEKVIFIQNVIPSRDNIPAYTDRKKMLEELIGTINGKHSSIQWQPIIYRYNHLEFEQLKALYKAADVALITPLRDGMNLVAKEYVASRNDGKGVLILSELTGAASELSEAILVNPIDRGEVAAAINQALNMSPSEQQRRLKMMQKRLKEYDVTRWVTDFLDQLQAVKVEQEKLQTKYINEQVLNRIIQQYQKSRNRLLLLDYDGTLSPFAAIPSQATPSEELLTHLKQFTADRKNNVVLISGRDEKTLSNWFGNLRVSLVAEHGASIKYEGRQWEKQFTPYPGWKEQIRPVMDLFSTRCPGSLVEEKENTLAWHYRNSAADLGFSRSRELMNTISHLLTNTPLQVVDGNKVLEVRQAGVNKGTTAVKLVEHFNADFVLCIGDDTTDEDMFNFLHGKGITIKIGSAATAADYNVATQSEVLPLLSKIINTSNTKEQNACT